MRRYPLEDLKASPSQRTAGYLMTFAEQRKHERVSVDIYVYWGWTEDCPFRDRIINLGVGGCFLRTDQEAPRERPLFIKFWLPDERVIRGEVRYHLERVGLGVEFKWLAAHEAAQLAALVEHYKGEDGSQ
ncbi:MAG TPA: PilZ domain-containing protein [Pyrinomonadaceae bacterium]